MKIVHFHIYLLMSIQVVVEVVDVYYSLDRPIDHKRRLYVVW